MNRIKLVGFWILFFVAVIGWSYARGDTNTGDAVTQYIDLDKCNKHDKVYYTVCWNNLIKMPTAGWTEILGDKINQGNIKARPNFYKDSGVKTTSPTLYKLPVHLGHTFANDSDNDYSQESLRSTYNMINITPMMGQLNIGMWRKVENRGKELAKKYGSVTSITFVEYNLDKKYNLVFPKKYTRVYSNPVVGIDECYTAENKLISATLNTIKVDCDEMRIK